MKRFRIRRSRRDRRGGPRPEGDAGGRPERQDGERRGGRRPRDGGAREWEDRPRALRPRAPAWPSDVAVPWERLLRFLIEHRDEDLSLWQVLDRLEVGKDQADLLRDQIARLEREGLVVHHRRGRVTLRSRDRLVVGRVSIPASSRAVGRHWGASGAFGFVASSDRGGDLYVPSRGLGGARHGDLVLAREMTPARAKRSQGAVVAVLGAAPSRFLGEVVEVNGRPRVRARDEAERGPIPLALEGGGAGGSAEASPDPVPARAEDRPRHRGPDRSPGAAVEAHPGDLVWAEETDEGAGRARIVEVIGPAEDPAAARRMIREAFGLPGAFPREAEEEAQRAARPLFDDDLRGREDFRSQTVITIDPADARDHDDAVSLERLPGAKIRLWVHIADVSHYVREGAALDREAAARGTSVYFPGEVIPMLPHALSSGVCSLVEGEDRLVQSVALDYSREARLLGVRFSDGVVRSSARLTYEEAAAAMEEGTGGGALGRLGEAGRAAAALLAGLAPLARELTRARLERGALDLDLPEVELRPAEEGLPPSLHVRDRTPAHRLIEEFMLAANEAVARHLSEAGVPAIFRVHEPPDAADVEEVEETLAALGAGRKGGRSLAARLKHLLARFRGSPGEAIVARQVLRAMKLARYADAREDHFGLALRHYTHFTSPIRRYPDLVVHRILRETRRRAEGARRQGRPEERTGGAGRPEGAEGRAAGGEARAARLAEIASESSRLERRAEEAERALDDIFVARALRDRVGEVFEGMVAGSARTGVFVALQGGGLAAGAAEGFAPTPRASRFVLTEPVRARLEEADLLRGRLRLSLVEA